MKSGKRMAGSMANLTFFAFMALVLTLGGGAYAEDNVLRLSLDDAIDIALARNLGLKLEAKSVTITDTQTEEEDAAFEPHWDSSGNFGRSDQPTSSIFEDIEDILSGTPPSPTISHSRSEVRTFSTGLYDRNQWGTEYSVSLDQTRTDTSQSINAILPYTDTSLGLDFSHPLLRNAGRKINTAFIRIAELNTDAQLLTYDLAAIDLIEAVERAYWAIHRRLADVEIAKASIKTADDLLGQNKAKVEVGVLRPIEVLSAESGLAARRQDLIVAEKLLGDAFDAMKRLLEFRDGDALWEIDIELADATEFKTYELEVSDVLADARDKRLELSRQDYLIDALRISEEFAENQLKPLLNISGGLSTAGFGGNTGNSYDLLGNGDHISWNAGVTLSIPLGNKAYKARYRRAVEEREQSELARADLERSIELEVQDAVRLMKSTEELVNASEITVQFATERLAAEEAAYEEGVTTSHEVLRFEEDLTTAKASYNQALIEHLNALVALRKARGTVLETAGVDIVSPLEN